MSHFYQRLALFFISLLIVLSFRALGSEPSSVHSNNAFPMQVKLLKGIKGREAYDRALLELVLDETRSEYGSYHIAVVNESFSVLRWRRELAKATLINLNVAAFQRDTKPDRDKLIKIPFPIMKGLLGYRAFIARKENVSEFSKVDSMVALRKLSVGQGGHWPESAIYRHAGFEVIGAKSYPSLFPMLYRKRFDILPLGISEIEVALKEIGDDHPSLAIVPNVVVFYPLPIAFIVSAREPRLAERLEVGLHKAQRNGKFDRLFNEHFHHVLQRFLSKDTRVFALHNPMLDDALGLDRASLQSFVKVSKPMAP